MPDPGKSLREGAIAPWNTPAYAHELEELLALADDYDLPVDVPFAELTDDRAAARSTKACPSGTSAGCDGFFRWLERRKYKMHLRVFLSRWRSYYPCPACGGARLRPEALAVRVGGQNIADVCRHEDSRRARSSSTTCSCPSGSSRSPGRCWTTCARGWRIWSTSGSATWRSIGRCGRSAAAKRSAWRSPRRSARAWSTCCTCSTSRRSACTRPTSSRSPRRSSGCSDRGNTVVVVEHEEAIIRARRPGRRDRPRRRRATAGEIVFQGTPAGIDGCARQPHRRLARRAAAASAQRQAAARPITAGSSCAARAATICRTSPSSFRSACCAW